MRICSDCKTVFEEGDLMAEGRGECWGTEAREMYRVCPCCGSTEHFEAVQCRGCGEWSEYGSLRGDLCEQCTGGMLKRVADAMRQVLQGFPKLEMAALRTLWEDQDEDLLDAIGEAF